MHAPLWFWVTTAFTFGICIGSFLNVAIYRLPIGKSLTKPEWSFCPNCSVRLEAIDLVPLVSFLALGRKCRRCKKPISWRYFNVELLTGLLFVALTLRLQGSVVSCVAMLLFASVCIPIFFIDLATFTIPNSLNLFAFVVAIGRDVWGIAAREPGHELLWGWLPRSVLGAVVGTLVFGAARVGGWLWKRVEAMGLGDVLLARAMGAMLVSVAPLGMNPLRLFPIWVMLACFSGLVVGPAITFQRRLAAASQPKTARGALTHNLLSQERERGLTGERVDEYESNLREQLTDIGWALALGDAWEYVRGKLNREAPITAEEEWLDEEPAPTAIPFGPFLVVGFLLTVFIGEPITAAYLAWALPEVRNS